MGGLSAMLLVDVLVRRKEMDGTPFGGRRVKPEEMADSGSGAGTAVLPVEETDAAERPAADGPWVTVVWNDPVNLMSYVTWVFCKLFGYSKPKAERLMLDVHQKGRASVSYGPRERMEFDASRLHGYGLWATIERQ